LDARTKKFFAYCFALVAISASILFVVVAHNQYTRARAEAERQQRIEAVERAAAQDAANEAAIAEHPSSQLSEGTH
jgi:hypothetical protein